MTTNEPQKPKGKTLNLYIPGGYDKHVALIKKLQSQGVDVFDQRGNLSYSKMLRYLVEEKLAELEPDRTAPRQQPATELVLKPTG